MERNERMKRITVDQALELWKAPLAELGAQAFGVKLEKSARSVFYNRNIHIEPTNICLFRCLFCSYRRAEGEEGAWMLSLDDIAKLAAQRRGTGITEVHIVGGVHPEYTLKNYEEMIRTVKRELPEVTVKAFTAVELSYIFDKAEVSITEGLQRLINAGMGAIPGGGAEIFDEELRASICPEKG